MQLPLFNKRGTEVEQERNPNERLTTVYSRKYYLAALTDETKAVKIIRSTRTRARTRARQCCMTN